MMRLSRILLHFFCIGMFVSTNKANNPNEGLFYQISHGICPEGLQHTLSILAGGAALVPGIALNNTLTNNYNDIHANVSMGLHSISAIAGMYAFYKINRLLAKQTPSAILLRKSFLLSKIASLTGQEFLTCNVIIKKLGIKFAPRAEEGLLILIKNELTELISDIEWVNEKLIVLHEPRIEQIDILKDALAKIVRDPSFNEHVKINKEYNALQYNNKISTKTMQTAWWLAKNGIKTTAQCSWYLTKVAANICWDTTKILLKAVIN